jgi:hypothetical protein
VAGNTAKAKPRVGTKVTNTWALLDETRVAEQAVSSAKRGADDSLRIRRAVQAHEELLETLDDLERLRVPCDELGGPAALETFPPIPEPPAAVGDDLAWWESEEKAAWESHLNRAANRLEDITKAGWKAFIETLSPAIPAEQILSNLEAASPELERECAAIRELVSTWETLAKKKTPDGGDAAAAEETAKAIEEGWQALEEAGGAPERLELLTKLSTLPPTITLADLTEDDWEWLLETDLASSVYLSIWED